MPQASIVQTSGLAHVSNGNAGIFVNLSGSYTFTKRLDNRGKRREFYCRIANISSHYMLLAVPVMGVVGERVITNCEEFGELEGTIERLADGGFVLKIIATDEVRAKLAAKIQWYDQVKNHNVPDSRMHKRIVPKNPHSTLLLADGSCVRCFVVDMSVSGVKVSAELEPEIGTTLAVGKVIGRVVRNFPAGFAIKFIQAQEPKLLERLIIQS